jgi:hypothetical protein
LARIQGQLVSGTDGLWRTARTFQNRELNRFSRSLRGLDLPLGNISGTL